MKILISKQVKIEKFYLGPFLLAKAIHVLLDMGKSVGYLFQLALEWHACFQFLKINK